MDEIIGVKITSDNFWPTSLKVFAGDNEIELKDITKLEISMVPGTPITAIITIPVYQMDILAVADLIKKDN